MAENNFKYKIGDKVVFRSSSIVRYLLEFQGEPVAPDAKVEEQEFNGTIEERYSIEPIGNLYHIITDFHVIDGPVPEESIIGLREKEEKNE